MRGLKCENLGVKDIEAYTSHPAWGAWIEMLFGGEQYGICFGRTPHGVRGLKWRVRHVCALFVWSHPAWGAWIEIRLRLAECLSNQRRTPHGVRGLKYSNLFALFRRRQSHPAWGAWIEILSSRLLTELLRRSHPAWGAWIEISR